MGRVQRLNRAPQYLAQVLQILAKKNAANANVPLFFWSSAADGAMTAVEQQKAIHARNKQIEKHLRVIESRLQDLPNAVFQTRIGMKAQTVGRLCVIWISRMRHFELIRTGEMSGKPALKQLRASKDRMQVISDLGLKVQEIVSTYDTNKNTKSEEVCNGL